MTDKQNPNKSELILSKNRSLAIKSSGLVKRGLALIDKVKKRQVEVLIGGDSDIEDTISEYLQIITKDKYDLKIRFSCFSGEILDLVKNDEIDIFILVVNNIISFPADAPFETRFENNVQLSANIKKIYGKPVIALSGWTEDSYVKKAKQAADFFFLMPFKLDVLGEAFEKCLSMLER